MRQFHAKWGEVCRGSNNYFPTFRAQGTPVALNTWVKRANGTKPSAALPLRLPIPFRWLSRHREELKPKKMINGDDLIALGIEPGPIMKEILSEAYSLQLEEKFKSKDQALDWVKKNYMEQKGKSK